MTVHCQILDKLLLVTVAKKLKSGMVVKFRTGKDTCSYTHTSKAYREHEYRRYSIVSYGNAPLTPTLLTVLALKSGPYSTYKHRTTHKIAWIQLAYMQVDGAHATYVHHGLSSLLFHKILVGIMHGTQG